MMRGGWRTGGALWIFLFLLGGGAAWGQTASRTPKSAPVSPVVQPVKPATPVKVRIGSHVSRYHRAAVGTPVIFVVQGPATFRVLSRLMEPVPTSTPRPYTLRCEVDGKLVKTARLSSVVSKKALLDGGARVGGSDKVTLRLPAGKHRVAITPEGAGTFVALRGLIGVKKQTRTVWVPFAPEGFEKALRLHEHDNESTVYRFTADRKIDLPVQGPVRLKVSTRLDFGPVNGTTQSYVVQAFLDGKLWKSFPLKSRGSHTASYPEMGEVTPGVARSFEIRIPKGAHRFQLGLAGSTAAGATARIQIPKHVLRTPGS